MQEWQAASLLGLHALQNLQEHLSALNARPPEEEPPVIAKLLKQVNQTPEMLCSTVLWTLTQFIFGQIVELSRLQIIDCIQISGWPAWSEKLDKTFTGISTIHNPGMVTLLPDCQDAEVQ